MRVPRSACDQLCSFRSSLMRSPRGMVLSSWFGVQAHCGFILGFLCSWLCCVRHVVCRIGTLCVLIVAHELFSGFGGLRWSGLRIWSWRG